MRLPLEIGRLASTLFCARATTTTTTATRTARLVIVNCSGNDKNHATHFTREDDSQVMPPRSARAHRIKYETRLRMNTEFCHFQAPANASAQGQRVILLRGGAPLVCHARLLLLLIKFGQISEYMQLHARCDCTRRFSRASANRTTTSIALLTNDTKFPFVLPTPMPPPTNTHAHTLENMKCECA